MLIICFHDVEGITELTKFIVNVLNLTIFVVKGNDLLQVIQKKVTAIEIAIFLGIPINESFLKELYKTYNHSTVFKIAIV